jgi:protein TonB
MAHVLIVAAIFALWVDRPIKPGVISLDFSILNFEEKGSKHGDPGKDDLPGQRVFSLKGHQTIGSRPAQIERKRDSLGIETRPPFPGDSISPGTTGAYSDREGNDEVYGKEGSPGGHVEAATGSPYLAGSGKSGGGGSYGAGDGQTIRYGTGSADERIFRYIREDILKNVKYPERARKRGHTGKIVVSFTVTEGGLTRDVKIVNGSGFDELDASAKDAVARTAFSRRIPNKLFVILPIEFRLE